jgi:hypothetical protein
MLKPCEKQAVAGITSVCCTGVKITTNGQDDG